MRPIYPHNNPMRALFSFKGVSEIKLRNEKKYSANYKANKKRNIKGLS